jgi:hypothetical protein
MAPSKLSRFAAITDADFSETQKAIVATQQERGDRIAQSTRYTRERMLLLFDE